MKKNLTELVFILDRSGSMAGLEQDTIGGFNSMVEKQKKEAGDALISTVLFDHRSEVIHDRVAIQAMEPLTDKQYYVRGTTALLDAVGGAIRHIRRVHKYIREEDRPEKTFFVITTDGMENASKEFDYAAIKTMIEAQKELGWEFIFLGANIDAAKEAARFGIRPECAADYHADSLGTETLYMAVNDAVSCARSCQPMGAQWKKSVEADYKTRSK